MDPQQIVGGLAIGSVYGSLALALVLIYRSTGVLNFAQGEMATFTTFIAWSLIVQVGLDYWVGFGLTVAIAVTLGFGVERIFVRPAYRAPHLALLVVTIGFFYLFNSLSLRFWRSDARTFPTPFPEGSMTVFGVNLPWVSVGILAVGLGLMAVLAMLFRFSRLGLAMRAVTSNRTASALVGINTGRQLGLGWGLATGVGAVAGMLAARPLLLDPNMLQGVLLYSFAAAVIGGLTSPVGAVLGGLIVGVISAVASGASFIGPDLATGVTFVVIVVILLLKPTGMFGRATAVKV